MSAARPAILSTVALSLLWLAARRIPAWQGAVAMSRPGQEDLTFWVNHNGLEQLDAIGEAGFGDMARILMRRRSNAEAFRNRDRQRATRAALEIYGIDIRAMETALGH